MIEKTLERSKIGHERKEMDAEEQNAVIRGVAIVFACGRRTLELEVVVVVVLRLVRGRTSDRSVRAETEGAETETEVVRAQV